MSSKEMEENRVFLRLSDEASNASRFINLKYAYNGFGIHQYDIYVFHYNDEENQRSVAGILSIDGTLSIQTMYTNECLCQINILDAEDLFKLYKYYYLFSVHREEQIPLDMKESKKDIPDFLKRR